MHPDVYKRQPLNYFIKMSMEKKADIKIFEEKRVRSIWDAEQENDIYLLLM